MNRGIYTAAAGMRTSQRWLDMTANNLANVSTSGFKRDGLAFADAMERKVRSGGVALGSLGSGAKVVEEFTIFEQGQILQTGRNLDVAINQPKGLFAVQMGPGSILYTRDGALAINAQGQLATKDGYPVLDRSLRPIDVRDGQIQISDDGTVMVDEQEAGKLALFGGTFRKAGSGMYTASEAKPIDDISLSPASLEGSNVNAIEEMIGLITIGRTFEMTQKSMQQQDELTQRLIQSLSDR
jgi:flagellar basal-body rod protein FlgF